MRRRAQFLRTDTDYQLFPFLERHDSISKHPGKLYEGNDSPAQFHIIQNPIRFAVLIKSVELATNVISSFGFIFVAPSHILVYPSSACCMKRPIETASNSRTMREIPTSGHIFEFIFIKCHETLIEINSKSISLKLQSSVYVYHSLKTFRLVDTSSVGSDTSSFPTEFFFLCATATIQ